MTIRSQMMICTACITTLAANPQSATQSATESTIQSATRNPQSATESAIQSATRNPQSATESAIQSAIRNPQSAMSGWRVLFDGKSLDNWRGYKNQPVPSGWRVENGTLAKNAPVADIVSKDEFGDFELEIDWKIGDGGNSGIFYRGTEEYDHIYWSAPEYQLLDDLKAADNKTRLTCAGAAYALYPSPAGHLKPIGEWNTARIIAKGRHVEHWLNGV
jgi:hypothetical protein